MSYLRISIRDEFSDALMKKLERAGPRAAHTLAEQIAKDTEPFVPARNKSLVNRTQVVGGTIVYPGPYARFLYHGKLMIDPKTGSAWAPKGAVKVVTDKDLDIKTAVHKQAQSHWFVASKIQNLDKWIRTGERVVLRELNK